MRKLPQVVAVLREERLIQIKRVAQLGKFAGRGAFAEHLFHGIAGHDVNHQKDQGKDEPQRGKGEQKTLREMTGDV
jgi:hypothetical protein